MQYLDCVQNKRQSSDHKQVPNSVGLRDGGARRGGGGVRESEPPASSWQSLDCSLNQLNSQDRPFTKVTKAVPKAGLKLDSYLVP